MTYPTPTERGYYWVYIHADYCWNIVDIEQYDAGLLIADWNKWLHNLDPTALTWGPKVEEPSYIPTPCGTQK